MNDYVHTYLRRCWWTTYTRNMCIKFSRLEHWDPIVSVRSKNRNQIRISDLVIFCRFVLTETNDKCTHFLKATGFIPPEQLWRSSTTRGPWILGDLVGTHFLARFLFIFFKVLFTSQRAYVSVVIISVMCYWASTFSSLEAYGTLHQKGIDVNLLIFQT